MDVDPRTRERVDPSHAAVVIKLDHNKFEKKVEDMLCDLVDESIFVYFESATAKECHEGFAYEDHMLGFLQAVDSFMSAYKSPGDLVLPMTKGHTGGRSDSIRDLPINFYLAGLGVDVIVPSEKRMRALERMEGLGDDHEYRGFMEYFTKYTKETIVPLLRQWRQDPSIFEEIIGMAANGTQMFVRWLESTGEYPFDFEKSWDLLGQIRPGNPRNEDLANQRTIMVTSFRDDVTVGKLKAKAREGRYKKFVIAVGSAHAKRIAALLRDAGWHTEFVEKGDVQGLVDTLRALKEGNRWAVF